MSELNELTDEKLVHRELDLSESCWISTLNTAQGSWTITLCFVKCDDIARLDRATSP